MKPPIDFIFIGSTKFLHFKVECSFGVHGICFRLQNIRHVL